MDIRIREAEAKDFEQVYNLIKKFAAFIQTPEKVSTCYEQMIADKDHFHCFIALLGDRVIGFATWFIAYYSWSGKAIYLDDLYVLEDYRGKGIGTRLMNRVIGMAKTKNCKKVKWQVSNWNKKAIEFYKTKGATIDEVEINCDLQINDT
jgi:GNAT superfamily N-acetyltransferase